MSAATLSHPQQETGDSRLSGRPLPPWQWERARRLHRLFRRVEKAQAGGKSARASFVKFSKRWHGHAYHCDPDRRIQAATATLYPLFRHWQDNGRSPAAMLLDYQPLRSSVPRDMLSRFVDFCAIPQRSNLKAVWKNFVHRERRAGGQRKEDVGISYGQLIYYVAGRDFAQLRAALCQAAWADMGVAAARARLLADIAARLPGPPRKRMKAE